MPNPLISPILGFASKLRFKTLFFISSFLLIVDLVTPDFVPFIDEILLGLLTLLFASWRKDKSEKQQAKNSDDVIEHQDKQD